MKVNIHLEELSEGVWLATSEDIQGLVAQGQTACDALEIAKDVISKLLALKPKPHMVNISGTIQS